MRRFFNIALTLFAAVAVGTSCGVNEDTPEVFTTMATVVEGTSSIPYYVVFDDGKEAYVTNTNEWSPSFSESITELRYIVSYELVAEKSTVFDMEIRLVSVVPMATQYALPAATAADFEGDSGLQNYEAGMSVEVCFLSEARDFLSLMLVYNGSAYNTSTPKMKLVYNTAPEAGPFKDLYTANDGYLYLELYHDAGEDMGTQEMATYLCCKMPDVASLKSQYSGVKILSFDHNSRQPEVFVSNFTSSSTPSAQ